MKKFDSVRELREFVVSALLEKYDRVSLQKKRILFREVLEIAAFWSEDCLSVLKEGVFCEIKNEKEQ